MQGTDFAAVTARAVTTRKMASPAHSLARRLAIVVISTIVACFAPRTYAQVTGGANAIASAQQITGNWEQVPVPPEAQPKILKQDPWPAQCQWFAYRADGVLKSLDQFKSPCEKMTSDQLDAAMVNIPGVQTWRTQAPPSGDVNFIVTSRSDVANYHEVWMASIATKAYSTRGIDFQEGDLVLYLFDLKAKQVLWVRHLRKL